MKRILLTFDVEEFDLPREFNQNISEEEMYEISKNGLFAVINLLDKHSIKATFFTTSNFAKKYPKIIKDLSKQGHEIACHGYSHSDDYLNSLSNIKIAKQEIEKIIKSKINGFRAPRFKIKNILGLSEFGFIYDSSLHPTWIPGRYMNLFKKRKIHKIEDITEIPLSTLPILRLPIFWLAFKNFGLNYAKLFTKINFLFSDYTMLFFHPWEFENLENFRIPELIKGKSGIRLINLLKNYILFCKKNNYSFDTISNYFQKSLR